MRSETRVRLSVAVVAACLLPAVQSAARGAEYRLSVSGPFTSASGGGFAYDGTDTTPLPPVFDLTRLTGGSFRATYLFTASAAPTGGNAASYNFDAPSALTYELLDAQGVVVHRGGNSSDLGALVFNDLSVPSGPVDNVNLYGFVNDVTDLITPAPRFDPTGHVYASQSSIGFGGGVTPETDYLTDLAIPLDAATLLRFPTKTFRTGMIYGDGDDIDFEGPYQSIETYLSYGITSVTVTAVPEPGVAGLGAAAAAGVVLGARRRR